MKVLLVIPARYASTRLPGKPLKLVGGLPMVVRVARQLENVRADKMIVIATDDDRILHVAGEHGVHSVLTGEHPSGTDRCAAAVGLLDHTADIVVNVQGDEPFIQASTIDLLLQAFDDPSVDIATLCYPVEREADLQSEHVVKVVRDLQGNALYFSRSPIPFRRDSSEERKVFKHIGIYAFRSPVLQQVSLLQQTPLEKQEALEQLRWLENGYRIRVLESDSDSLGIDTQEDLETANAGFND